MKKEEKEKLLKKYNELSTPYDKLIKYEIKLVCELKFMLSQAELRLNEYKSQAEKWKK